MRLWRFIAAVGLLLGVSVHAAQVGLIKIDGAIGPATASYIARALDTATEQNDECLVIQLDTPGGLLESTKQIVQSFYASKVPVVVYVTPSGASAGSAGVFITMAADVAVMAPHTSIGAAHPVEIGSGGNVEKTDDVMKEKLENYTSSFVESIADKRHRNVEWAKSAVVKSEATTAEKALDLEVIDLIAADMPDLLKQLEGWKTENKTLHTANASVVEIPMRAWEHFSQIFLRPEVMFILMLMVIYGFIGELSSPGAILPGVVGAVALVLVLYMSAALPVNIAGLALIGLAVVLFIIDVFASTHGILTAGGIVAFFVGALMLFSQDGPGYHLSLSWIISGTLVTAAFFILIMGKGLRAQLKPASTGREAMIGRTVNAPAPIDAAGGKIFIEGETWNAVSATPVAAGAVVEITGITGLTLQVKPKQH
ncbi:MAG TPA: nodulation protein NfeD [Verrucomicrobiae bacterium]|nr:nodulation protein NfeD [Verrucomicrobiae bacterium]